MKKIKFPYVFDKRPFLEKLAEFMNKEGFRDYLVIYAEATSEHYSRYNAVSSVVSEGMIEYVEETILPDMKDTLENHEL